MRKHKWILWLLIALAVAIVAVGVGAYALFGTQLKAAMSVQALEPGLYAMEYVGDYGFDAFLAEGGAASNAEMADYIVSFLSHGFWKPDTASLAPEDFGCSTLAVAAPEGQTLFGRNYDGQDCTAMLVRTQPQDGYASVSTVCLDYLGFGEGWTPDGMMDRFLAQAAVYVPLDGMNEKGLCVADLLAGDDTETHQQTDKPDLTTTAAIRLLLDRAATVDEAIDLLGQYDMHSVIGTAHHLSLCDATGRAVVVEYVDDAMIVTDTPVVTNFYLTPGPKYGVGSAQSHTRYDTLTALLETSGGVMTAQQVRDALGAVAQSNFPDSGEATQWSLVYDTQAAEAWFYWKEGAEGRKVSPAAEGFLR